ncbi:MAG: Phosphoribosyl transferase domain, partial [Patescibacteria group bacterium]|nr:Phosphoribosyl transferase domain [Patescibacteria group bacterium]
QWLDVPCEMGLLKRHFKKRSQVGKGKFERKQQVAAPFFCNEKVLEKHDKGTCFVIIDDVCTTGSTLSACTGLLKERGFAVIGCAIASSR